MTSDEARAAGLKFYFGVRCARGHYRRYTANRMCVTCSAAHAAARKRGIRVPPAPPKPPAPVACDIHAARLEGVIHYHGRPHTCGSTVRYTSSTKCVKCENARTAARAAR